MPGENNIPKYQIKESQCKILIGYAYALFTPFSALFPFSTFELIFLTLVKDLFYYDN